MYKAAGDLRRESHTIFKKKKPEVQVQMSQLDKISGAFMGSYTHRNHVAPRTKLYVPKDEFSFPVNYIDVQRQTKTSIDVLHEATIDDYWNVDGVMSLSEPRSGVTRFDLLNQKSTRRTYVGSRLTDEETGHFKTWKYVAGRMDKHVRERSA